MLSIPAASAGFYQTYSYPGDINKFLNSLPDLTTPAEGLTRGTVIQTD